MPLPFLITGQFTGSIHSASYLKEADHKLFFDSQERDLWYGFSENDVQELSVFDLNGNIITWDIIYRNKNYKTIELSFLNEKNETVIYSYKQLVPDYIQYKNDKILVNVSDDLKTVSPDGYTLLYNFTRTMAGDPSGSMLSISEISPSRKEIKLIFPNTNGNTQFTAFCTKRFLVKDVVPIVFSYLQQCPYTEIYNKIKSENKGAIETIRTLFFLPDDDKFITFLKNLYEDVVTYTSLTQSQIDGGFVPDRLTRITGIRTNFNNSLSLNYETIWGFSDIRNTFSDFVTKRINDRFSQIGELNNKVYAYAKKFIYDFFVKEFYDDRINILESKYNEKYYAYLSNALNFGHNKLIPILDHTYSNEPDSSISLVVKLLDTLPLGISLKDSCWISNISMPPYLFNIVLKTDTKTKTILIKPADFSSLLNNQPEKTFTVEYTKESISDNISPIQTQNIDIEKNLAKFNTDFSEFSNFVNFSSAELRLNIFKNKIILLSQLSGSLSASNSNITASVSSSAIQVTYVSERDSLQTKIDSIIDELDDYERYLYKSGKYLYSLSKGKFVNELYVDEKDDEAKLYDKNNRNSLINTTPEYILVDQDNDEYLIFLSMIGHYFDNISNAISGLPAVRSAQNDITKTIPKTVIEEMLKSFGWNPESDSDLTDITNMFLNNETYSNYSQEMSAEQRQTTIWNRLLITLPQLYKTKGTVECLKHILACYGIPSSLLNIREYGGSRNNVQNKVNYHQDERVYLLNFTKNNEYIQVPYSASIATIEFKISPKKEADYVKNQRVTLVKKNNTAGNKDWELGLIKLKESGMGKLYFNITNNATQSINYELTSSNLPLFNGDIFSLMIRKNKPVDFFESNLTASLVPSKYDLYVQKNDDGRIVFQSTSSVSLPTEYNQSFINSGSMYFGNKDANTFYGILDKILVWNDPVSDTNYSDHVNNINSYSFSGSAPYQSLYFRFHYDIPVDLNNSSSNLVLITNANEYYSSSISGSAFNFPIVGYTASLNALGCPVLSSSYYPYQFEQKDIIQYFVSSNYGPNTFKNDKINRVTQIVDTCLDPAGRSSETKNKLVLPDSNQVGLFINPQDYRNKDIFRFFGSFNIFDVIGDPGDIYKNTYSELRTLRYSYAASGNKRTLFNEFITLYKFYFNKSIFETIKQVIPARSNILTGLLIESSVLERSKYESKTIDSEVASGIYEGSVDNIVKISAPLYDEFKYVVPEKVLNHSSSFWGRHFQPFGTPAWNQNLGNGYTGQDWYLYRDSNVIFVETQGVWWNNDDYRKSLYDPIINTLSDNFLKFLTASINIDATSSYKISIEKEKYNYSFSVLNPNNDDENRDMQFEAYGDEMAEVPGLYKDYDSPVSSSNKYLFKKWTKKTIRDVNINGTESTSSIYTYTIVPTTKLFYESMVYTSSYIDNSTATKPIVNTGTGGRVDVDETIVTNWPTIVIHGNNYQFFHNRFTQKRTPNQTVSNIIAKHSAFKEGDNPIYRDIGKWDISESGEDAHYEIFTGYPRYHYTHTRQTFSKERYATITGTPFTKGRQTEETTVIFDVPSAKGIDDKSHPIEPVTVGNVNIINTNTVLSAPPQIQVDFSAGGGGGCLLAGTKILMANGDRKNVEDVTVGDVLLSDERKTVTVLKLMPNKYREYYIINNKLFITHEHPIMTITDGQKILKEIGNIKINDNLWKFDGTIEKVASIEIITKDVNTYNFIVDEPNLYIAEDFVVHNVAKIKF